MAESQTRAEVVKNMNNAVEDARLIGFNDSGEACVWSGGTGFNVYDAKNDWSEMTHFTSGQLAAIRDRTAKEAYGYAKERMKSAGFEVVE